MTDWRSVSSSELSSGTYRAIARAVPRRLQIRHRTLESPGRSRVFRSILNPRNACINKTASFPRPQGAC
jgi:hypothetical protein